MAELNGRLLFDGKHPIDVPMEEFTETLETITRQPLKLSLPASQDLNLYACGLQKGSLIIDAQSVEPAHTFWRYYLYNQRFLKLNPASRSVKTMLDQERAAADPGRLSEVMMIDAEIEPLGNYALTAIKRTLNVPFVDVQEGLIALDNVSHTQAGRIVDVIRQQYTQGDWRRTVQLVMAADCIQSIVPIAKMEAHTSEKVVTISDGHLSQEFTEQFKTDVDFLLLRALQRAIQELQAEGRGPAADHAADWLDRHKITVTINTFTPEITLYDMMHRPSPLHPAPAKGLPQFLKIAGSGGACYGRYDSGDEYVVYLPFTVDPPGEERFKFDASNLLSELKSRDVAPYEGLNEYLLVEPKQWVEFAPFIQNEATIVVEKALSRHDSSKRNVKDYKYILNATRAFCQARPELFHPPDQQTQSTIENFLAAILSMACSMERAEQGIGLGLSLFKFISFYSEERQLVDDNSNIHNINLNFSTAWDQNEKTFFLEFGHALEGLELGNLADIYAGHPEFSGHIARYRILKGFGESPETYRYSMLHALQWFIGRDDKMAQLGRELLNEFGFQANSLTTIRNNGELEV